MGKNDFLKNLKDSLDNGEFNSDVAKKFNEIEAKANEILKSKTSEEIGNSINEKIDSKNIKRVSEEQMEELNSQYEQQMKERAKEERIFAIIATLNNIENEIDNNLMDMKKLINDSDHEYNQEDEKCVDLFKKIKELQNKYMLNN